MTKDEFYFWSTMATLVVALCALCFSFWQGINAREHNRLSVMPVLKFQIKREPDSYHLELRNCGVGPANIQSFQRYCDGEEVSAEEHLEYVIEHMESKGKYTVCSSIEGFMLPAGDSMTILKVTHESKNNLELTKLFSKKCLFSVGYNSIYKEKKLSYHSIR